jgi:hypothetical protein
MNRGANSAESDEEEDPDSPNTVESAGDEIDERSIEPEWWREVGTAVVLLR